MEERNREIAAEPTAVPARIQLDDLTEAVTRGVLRALQAEDDVVGFTPTRKPPTPPVTIGIVITPPPPSTTIEAPKGIQGLG
ncbi:MAG: hypothetical protein ACRDJE_11280 [Dehalococcoidia bacterium]